MGGVGALSGVKQLILAGILTILDMVERAWSILASQVSGGGKQPVSAAPIVFPLHF